MECNLGRNILSFLEQETTSAPRGPKIRRRDCLAGIDLRPVICDFDWGQVGVARRFGRFREEGEFTDVEFVCGGDGGRLEAHRAVLGGVSSNLTNYFRQVVWI